jgi:microcystin-dependent protein
MSDPFLGEIRAVGFDFAPPGWVSCQGQLLAIQQFSALFSLLGTHFGGDGVNTFAVPDLRSRSPVGIGGSGPFTPFTIGNNGGAEQVALTQAQMPLHTHTATLTPSASNTSASGPEPGGNIMGLVTGGDGTVHAYATSAEANTTMAPQNVVVANAGGNAAVPLRNPYLAVNFIIATAGIYPSRT